jgi:hypothetical protein
MRILLLMFAAIVLAVSANAASISPDEAKAQAEFKKAYANPNAKQRKEAPKILLHAVDPSSWQMLAIVVNTDTDRDVRWIAFSVLGKMPPRDPLVSHLLADSFTKSDKRDQPMKIGMAKLMAASPFKTEIAGAIVDHMYVNMRYPEFVAVDPTSTNNDAAINLVKTERKEFSEMLAVFNKLTGAELAPSANARTDIKKWFQGAQADLAREDRETLDKFRKEDAEKAKAK